MEFNVNKCEAFMVNIKYPKNKPFYYILEQNRIKQRLLTIKSRIRDMTEIII